MVVLNRIYTRTGDKGTTALAAGGRRPKHDLRIEAAQTERLEQEIDQMNQHLTALRSFVLPGGTAAAAALHLARTVCRRAERLVVALGRTQGEALSPAAVQYLNRLSDFLFVAARLV